jgi:NADPH-dependent F420 reductase
VGCVEISSVGIIGGTGPAGSALGCRLAASGLQVFLGSRDPARARELVAEQQARWPDKLESLIGMANEEACSADIIVLATPWDKMASTARAMSNLLAQKVVVSMGNAMMKLGPELQPMLLARGSVAEMVQTALPASKIAGAFHHLPASTLGNLAEKMDADVLVCSDWLEAAEATICLIDKVPGLRGVRAGSLAFAGPIESFTAVLVAVNMGYKCHSSIRITGIGQR